MTTTRNQGRTTFISDKRRCAWPSNSLAIAYHDNEWGVPVHSERKLFECLTLEGAQAGLSWDTVLAKRDNYRRAFDGFDFRKVAAYGARERRRLQADAGIVRHAGKIDATIENAKRVLEVKKELGSFSKYIWSFAGQGAEALSKDLRKRGFRFVGPTTVYAFMQAVGMVNDHEERCFRRTEIGK
jgi:DNA-3-methyladenine glycosylase I